MADATTDFRTVIETTPTCRFYRPDPVPGDVLAGLPRRSLRFDMPPEYVFRAVGVTYRP